MKKLIKQPLMILGMFFLTMPLLSNAQTKNARSSENKENREKVEALKKEYLTKELSLTEAEAQKFWPIYDELDKKLNELRKKDRAISKELKENFETLSDADLKSKTDALFASEAAAVQLKKDYLQKYATVLGQKRATKVLHLEREFKKELMKRMKENRE